MPVTKHDKNIQNLAANFGDAKFSDILNRLWVMGVDPNKLKDALATTSNGTNDPTDIITRLLNKGIVTEDQLKAAPNQPVPQVPGEAWPFTDRRDGRDPGGQPLTVPVHTQVYNKDLPNGGVQLPNAQATIPTTSQQPVIPNANLPGAGTGGRRGTTTRTVPTDTKKQPDTSTAAGREEYEKEHFSTMLWIKDIPELKQKMEDAAKGTWSPERFQAEVQSTDWWKTHSDTFREYIKLKADPQSFKQAMELQKGAISAYTSQFGFNLDDNAINTLADQSLQMKWDPGMLKKQVVNQAQYRADQGGELGADMGLVKNHARNFFQQVSDQEAFNTAKQLAAGDIDEATILGNMRQKAKAAWPSLGQLIDQGVAPREAMSNQINTAAQLLELDPDQVDPTDHRFTQMISMTDDKGVARPMTVDETTKFVKSMDDYWKTGNAADEVGQKVTQLAKFMGRTV